MKGGIYSDERCFCGKPFKDNGKDALVCPNHPEQKATRFKVKFGRKICRRFESYKSASRFLTGLRYKTDEGTLDLRDYMKDNPLGFKTLTEKWLSVKKVDVKPGTYKNLANYMRRAVDAWGQRNIKEIDYADIEDFLLGQKLERTNELVSDKTRVNMRSALHDFWEWARKRRVIKPQQMPEFPEVKFELGYRNTIGKTIQEAILDDVFRISYHINPKIWLGIKWLCTYISLRPGELIGMKEKQIDLENGYLIIPHPKEKKPKLVPLLEEDVKLVKSMPRSLPGLPFFRHGKGIQSCKPGQPFGQKYLYKWWKKACANLGIEDVDLYGGTRHSSVRALRKYRTPEEIKLASMHSTNKAFERYFRIESHEVREIYRDAVAKKKGKVLRFKKTGRK